jgi:hypothetical protein
VSPHRGGLPLSIAAIRTALNCFLSRVITEERAPAGGIADRPGHVQLGRAVSVARITVLEGSCVVLMAPAGRGLTLLVSRRLEVALRMLLCSPPPVCCPSPHHRRFAVRRSPERPAGSSRDGMGLWRGQGTDQQSGVPGRVTWRLWQILRAGAPG